MHQQDFRNLRLIFFDPFFWEELGKPFKGTLRKDFIRNNYRPYWSYFSIKKQPWLRTSVDENDEEGVYRHSPFIRFDAKKFNEWALKNMDWILKSMSYGLKHTPSIQNYFKSAEYKEEDFKNNSPHFGYSEALRRSCVMPESVKRSEIYCR